MYSLRIIGSVVWFHNLSTLEALSIKIPKGSTNSLASGVFVDINKSHFSVYSELKEMTLQLASVVWRGGFRLLARNMVFRVIRDSIQTGFSKECQHGILLQVDWIRPVSVTLRDILWIIIIILFDKLRKLEKQPEHSSWVPRCGRGKE